MPQLGRLVDFTYEQVGRPGGRFGPSATTLPRGSSMCGTRTDHPAPAVNDLPIQFNTTILYTQLVGRQAIDYPLFLWG